jgi:hypothetical protein
MTNIQTEIDTNYEAFRKMLPSIIYPNRDKFALMKGGVILGYFSSSFDAKTAAKMSIQDGIYSIQRVTDTSVDLGYFSHAVRINTIQP